MNAAPSRRAFQTIEALRGVGAFLVVMRHVPYFFGPVQVPESFLAVDLFYLVSGFVVAHAYGQRLAAGGFVWTFMKTRIIRLYPLYFIGVVLGVIAASYSAYMDPKGFWNWGKIGEGFAAGLFLIPIFPGLSANGSTLDGPTWTLVPELIANLAYALLIRFLKLWLLAAIIVIGGVGVVAAELTYGTLDVGYSPTDQWTALARVTFSFFAGVLVYRLVGERMKPSAWMAWVCVAVLAFLLAWSPSDDIRPAYEIGAVLVAFPALLVVASRYEPGPRVGRVFSFVGLMSYGVYVLHQPLGNLSRDLLKCFMHIPRDWSALGLGVVFLAAVLTLAWQLDVRYDAPMRRKLRARFMGERPKSASA
ncbi:MAG TPA: acyltransferase [Caulobacteraceae bacterium]|nr:acyltransferase [Caulobacteraceae bacterium]